MEGKQYFIVIGILLISFIALLHYVGTYNALFALADNSNSKHFVTELECDADDFCINTSIKRVGVGTIDPQAKLDIVGGLRIGKHTDCDFESEGVIRYFNGNFQGCNGNEWVYLSSFPCGENYTDHRDGNIYPTIQIGNQCWMAKNLAYLPSVVGASTESNTVAYYYVYGYNGTDVNAAKATTNYSTYGVLYNWTAASTACPSGWHLPTDAEQYTLENYYSTGTCTSDRDDLWECDPSATLLGIGGESGFEFYLGGGVRTTGGTFEWMDTGAGGLYLEKALKYFIC